MISVIFQQLKKKKFRGFSTYFGIPRINLLIYKVQKMGKTHILFNFSKNAVIFKTSYIYQNTNVCSEIPFSKNLYQIEASQLIICNTNQWTGF